MSSPLSFASLTSEWRQGLWAPPDASPRTEEPKCRKRTAVSQQQRDATGATNISTHQTQQQALALMRGSDAPPGTLERFGEHTEMTRSMLKAAKDALTTKPQLVEEGVIVVDGEKYKHNVFMELEKIIYHDFEQSIVKVCQMSYHLRKEAVDRAIQATHANNQLRNRVIELEETNSRLQSQYDQAMEEIRKLHAVNEPLDPLEQAAQESDGLDLSLMAEMCDSLFTEDGGFLGEITGEVAF